MDFSSFFATLGAMLPGIIGALLLLILALILAWGLKRLTIKGLEKVGFSRRTQSWGMAKTEEEGQQYTETVGSIVYFATLLFFLPGILNGLNVGGVMDPIVNMFNKFFSYIPNILTAIVIIVVGAYFCKFVKKLVRNLLLGLNIDKWYAKLTGSTTGADVNEGQIAEVLATVVYVLIFIPILTVALETLGIQSISEPIVAVLNQILSAIPNIITAAVLLIIGGVVAKLLGDLIENLLATTGVDKYSRYLNFRSEVSDVKISNITAAVVKGVLMLFFLVEAISVLNLEVLNTIGAAIIAYIPLVLSAIIILAVALIGGNILANFISKATGNKLFGEVIRYAIIVLGAFMILEQLHIAQTIVNAGFIIILGAAGLAVALAFGLGGRDFAARQLNKADKAIDEEIDKAEDNNNHTI